jgi:hypothetical protein
MTIIIPVPRVAFMTIKQYGMLFIAFVLGLWCAISIADNWAATSNTDTVLRNVALPDDSVEQVAFDAINKFRDKNGLSPLIYSKRLSEECQEYAKEMSSAGSVKRRMRVENLAKTNLTGREGALNVVEQWKAGTDDRKYMLSSFTDGGIACCDGYWVFHGKKVIAHTPQAKAGQLSPSIKKAAEKELEYLATPLAVSKQKWRDIADREDAYISATDDYLRRTTNSNGVWYRNETPQEKSSRVAAEQRKQQWVNSWDAATKEWYNPTVATHPNGKNPEISEKIMSFTPKPGYLGLRCSDGSAIWLANPPEEQERVRNWNAMVDRSKVYMSTAPGSQKGRGAQFPASGMATMGGTVAVGYASSSNREIAESAGAGGSLVPWDKWDKVVSVTRRYTDIFGRVFCLMYVSQDPNYSNVGKVIPYYGFEGFEDSLERVINGTDHVPISEYAGRADCGTEETLPGKNRKNWNSARIATQLTGEGGSLSDAYKRQQR